MFHSPHAEVSATPNLKIAVEMGMTALLPKQSETNAANLASSHRCPVKLLSIVLQKHEVWE
jgi:hypothetical protein